MKTKRTKHVHTDYLANIEIRDDAEVLFKGILNTFKNVKPDVIWRHSSEEHQNDKGIDYQIEVENKKTRETLIIFKTQNKGTAEKLVPIKIKRNNGMIPFSIKVKHVNYYRREINIALVYIICDLQADIVYWHPIQLDDSIDDQVELAIKKNQDSVTMYLSQKKQLNINNVEEFIDDVVRSQQVQTYRHDKNINHELLSGNDKIKIDRKKPLLAQLEQFTGIIYKELRYYPTHLLVKHYPFVKENKTRVYYSGGIVDTDNEELIDFLNSVDIADNGDITFNDPASIAGVVDPEKTFLEFYDKLHDNSIYSIKNREHAFHVDYKRQVDCDCSNCLMKDLKFTEALARNTLLSKAKLNDILHAAYIHYKFGNYVKSAELYKSILRQAKDLPVITVICEYNLKKLGQFITTNYWKEKDSIKVMHYIRKIDLKQAVEKHRTDHNAELLKWITEGNFFKSAIDEIDDLFRKIKEHHQSQLNRGWSSNSHINLLFNAFERLETFLYGNYVVYDHFQEYGDLATLFSEAVYASYSMNDEQESRLTGFSDWTIDKLMFHANPQKLNDHFWTYNIDKIRYKHLENGISFLDRARNLFTQNKNFIAEMSKKADYGRNNFIKRYKKVCSNVIVLISQLELSDVEVEEMMDLIIPYFKEKETRQMFMSPYFKVILSNKPRQISNRHLQELFDLTIKDLYFSDEDLILQIMEISEDRSLKLKLTKTQGNKLIRDAFEVKHKENGLTQTEHFYYYYELLSTEAKAAASKKAELLLIEKFSIQDYYMAAIFGILPIENEFFRNFKTQAVPRRQNSQLTGLFGRNMNSSTYCDMFLNLCFKHELDLSGSDYDDFRGITPYYDWLTNMADYDYSRFQVRWLLAYPTGYYSRAFKKQPILKKVLGEYLRKHRDGQLERFYIDNFTD